MSLTPEDWTVNSTETLKVSIVTPESTKTFQPQFTYPIFGDSEQIFGYKGLEINLKFDSITFLPLLLVKYSAKLNDDVVNIKSTLLEFLPASTIVNDEASWLEQVKNEKAKIEENISYHFKKLASYPSLNKEFSIYKTQFDNDFSIELNKRLQILILLFIEAGSYIDASDSLWSLYLTLSPQRDIIGFTTVYSYFKYPGARIFDEGQNGQGLKREKISQFIIFPNYQKSKHGSKLYTELFEYFLKDPKVQEITVEDPNESFDDLRYINDAKRLWLTPIFSNLPNDIKELNSTWFKNGSIETKIELNQFKKLTEITYIFQKKNLKLTRLLIKKRLYEKNKDGLLELEKQVMNDKLQTAYERIKQDYERLIEIINPSATHEASDDRGVKRQKI